uniref:Putative salivary protein SG1B n=1 Tax=Anopheles stephensi TaxID=30069 RepID=Q8I6P3_ANOST|nr:putative salivary protein SG1B [Anopheles stephensi]
MCFRVGVLSLLLHALFWTALYAEDGLDYEDPFEDDSAQCQITVTPDMMLSLANTLQTEISCDEDLWGNFLLQYHLAQENLTDCMERSGTVDDSFNVFCQQLVDYVQDQLDQEHRAHSAELERKLHLAQQEAQKHHDEKEVLGRKLDRLQRERAELVLDLLLANIAIGDIKQAIVYYRQYPAQPNPNKLYEQIVRSVYRVTMYQDQRLLHLISFVRSVDSTVEKLALYRLILAEIQKRTNQRNTYIAAVFALNVKADRNVYATEPKLYTDAMVPLETLWKDQLANGNYKAVIEFATRQPKYYAEMQTTLATVDKAKWAGLKFDKFVPYLNSLPQPAQRVAALRQVLDQIREHSKQNPQKHLVLTAKELDICEVFMTKVKADQNAKRSLEELKSQFVKFKSGKDYKYYLNESRKAKG